MADSYGPAWNEAGIEQRCRDMRAAVLETGLALAEECDDYAPGGDRNPETGIGAWVWYYFSLGRMWGRGEKGMAVDPVAEAAALAAITEEPVTVDLVSGGTLKVYPKSVDTLIGWVAPTDQLLGILAAAVDRLQHSTGDDAVQYLPTLAWQLAHQLGLLAWTLTTEGPGVPPAIENSATPPELPDHIKALDPLDYIAIRRAHLQVDGMRLTLTMDLVGIGGKGTGARPSWATLASTAAPKLNVSQAKRLLKDWSAGAFLGQFLLAAGAERDAVDAARRV